MAQTGLHLRIKSPTDTVTYLSNLLYTSVHKTFSKLVFFSTNLTAYSYLSFYIILCETKFYRARVLGAAHPPVFCLFILFLLASTIAQQVEASPKFSIVWATDTHTGSTNFLKDNNNQALNSGQSINGDGDLVELGYFSQGSFVHPLQDNAFLGEWIPLTQNTRVGDSSSGYGFSDGMLAFRTTFTRDANYVTTYWGEPKYFVEYLNFQISSTTPPPQTTPVCVRFYDSPFKGGGARFNTVTGPGWRWPTFPNGSNIPTTTYFKIASGNAPAGSFWIHGSTFEDPNAPFVASKLPDHSIHFEVLAGSENLGTIKINDQNTTFTFNAQPYGTIFNLKAIPGPHSYFNRWVGTGIDEFWNEMHTLVVDGDQNISAEFAKVPYLLNLSSLGDGMVYGSGSFSSRRSSSHRSSSQLLGTHLVIGKTMARTTAVISSRLFPLMGIWTWWRCSPAILIKSLSVLLMEEVTKF